MLLSKVLQLINHREQGDIPRMHQHEVNPWADLGSRENYLYFTLPVALNFQRSSPAMWQSALATWHDSETNYLFYPEQVVQRSFEQLQSDLTKHRLALQRNKHVQIRQRLCQTLSEQRDNDPRSLIHAHSSDVLQIRDHLISHKKDYPYLNGPKMCDYWMFIMSHYTDIDLINKHMLSIIPDTHIQQASIVLWITTEKDGPEQVKEKRFGVLAGSGIAPVDLHSMLWNWSRNNFLPQV